ncbi:FkbM family methyltransferase [Peribacillus frigoritolerans]|uniref:FkbM family methyltransferase n=1 Tax=Peribacillus frigoritolerans TaxID=450367 RepID=UPI00105AACA6|nr:FkbM family methyltransferase [Peribacillus frigoritolerans]TDL80788.1 FkbM family methyltransferase [Peribacillus frigoritolerans]
MINKAAVRKPFLMKMWEQYPKLWKGLIDFGILMKYRTLDISKLPDKIVLPSSTVLYVDAKENRGRALLISGGVTQKRLLSFWQQAVEAVKPDYIIDIGVNYGECIFSIIYPKHTKIFGIEANQNLLTYISKSRDAHPNHSQIKIVHAFASDSDGEDKRFFIDNHWSGTSSASYMPAHHMVDEVSVQSITVDSLLNNSMENKVVLFKIDVEGYEAFVLKGMRQLFENSRSVLGFIEFNSDYFEKTGVDPNSFFEYLNQYFTIYVYKENDDIVKVKSLKIEDLHEMFGSDYVHTDLILATDAEIADSLTSNEKS